MEMCCIAPSPSRQILTILMCLFHPAGEAKSAVSGKTHCPCIFSLFIILGGGKPNIQNKSKHLYWTPIDCNISGTGLSDWHHKILLADFKKSDHTVSNLELRSHEYRISSSEYSPSHFPLISMCNLERETQLRKHVVSRDTKVFRFICRLIFNTL